MRLIDGDVLIAWIKESQHMTSKMRNVICKVETMPSVDRAQGEWIVLGGTDFNGISYCAKCSNCKAVYDGIRLSNYSYCPHCGASMRRRLDAKIVANGNCALCGKPLSDGRLFVCKECEEHTEEGADDE